MCKCWWSLNRLPLRNEETTTQKYINLTFVVTFRQTGDPLAMIQFWVKSCSSTWRAAGPNGMKMFWSLSGMELQPTCSSRRRMCVMGTTCKVHFPPSAFLFCSSYGYLKCWCWDTVDGLYIFVWASLWWSRSTIFPRIVCTITINLKHWVSVNTKGGQVQLPWAMQFERLHPHM